MNYFIIINLFLISVSVEAFKAFSKKHILTKLRDTSFSEYGMKEKVSIGQLINQVNHHDIENVYFSNDLKKIYSKKIDSNEKLLNKYRVTNSNPVLTDKMLTLTDSNHVNAIILDPYNNPFEQTVGAVSSFFDTFFISISIFFVISFLTNILQQNPQMNNSMSINPFSMKNIKNNKAKENMIKANISLSSWAGSPEIYEECIEIVSYLKNNTDYKNVGAEIPRGILLEGPPGTGKTLIAKAIASESNANFISVAASEFVELFVGLGASKVRNLFKDARENAPSIIFIDEIDAIGRQRGAGINMGNDEREQTLNQILAEMDGFESNENVIVIAATNRKDVLDAALLRPGRFDRLINVPLPDKNSRINILELYLKNKNVEENIKVDFLAQLTAGFSGAQLKNLLNEAAINAARLGKTVITQKNIEDALEKIVVGIVKKTDTRSDESRLRVAVHEMGHAYLAALFNEYFQLQKVTIQPTYNGAGGFTILSEHPDISESGLYTKDLLKKRLIIALGGKAAEEVFYGNNFISLGASQDLKQANSIAQRMIGNYGMGNKLKVFYNENIDSDRNPFLGKSFGSENKYSESTKEEIDKEYLNLVNEAYEEAFKIIHEHKEKITLLIKILFDSTTLQGEFIKNYIEQYDNNDNDILIEK